MKLNNTDAAQMLEDLDKSRTSSDLYQCLIDTSQRMGFTFFALTEHINTGPSHREPINIVHYPQRWDGMFRRKRLFGVDPVHRASNTRALGFLWSDVPRLIPMSKTDHRIFELARGNGLGDGFTVPSNVPGYLNGSCSFGMKVGQRIDRQDLPMVHFVGTAAFEAARRLQYGRSTQPPTPPRLTDRQLDCVALFCRGLTTAQIAKALNVSAETVVQHIKDAGLRYGVRRRTPLAVRALFDGSLSFTDVMPPKSPHSWG